MARKKLTEYKAKKLLFTSLGLPYEGMSMGSIPTKHVLDWLSSKQTYVVKVDQGVKKRAKQGLLAIDVPVSNIKNEIENLHKKGYAQFLVEPFVKHDVKEEKYVSLERVRDGIMVRYSTKGGVDIEEHLNFVVSTTVSSSRDTKKIDDIARALSIPVELFAKIFTFFDDMYISFLEVNPLVVVGNNIFFLDLAIEVDSAGEFFVKNGWTQEDFAKDSRKTKTPEELAVIKLNENSQASLKLDVLNPNGSLFTLFSGGGASITLADEAYNEGFGKELANYADYSGNPSQEETYLYTKELLSLLKKSKARRKALIIAGGVANFTNIKRTFTGIIQALQEEVETLQREKIKIFVRRPGPNQEEGLAMMTKFLEENNLYGGVWDERLMLTDVINKAHAYVD